MTYIKGRTQAICVDLNIKDGYTTASKQCLIIRYRNYVYHFNNWFPPETVKKFKHHIHHIQRLRKFKWIKLLGLLKAV